MYPCIYMASSPLPSQNTYLHRKKRSCALREFLAPTCFLSPGAAASGAHAVLGLWVCRALLPAKRPPSVSTGAVYSYSTVIATPADAALRDMYSLLSATGGG